TPHNPTTNHTKKRLFLPQNFRLGADAERSKPSQSPGKLIEASGTRRSRAASKPGAHFGGLAAHFRDRGVADLWNSCRRAIGRGANVDRPSQARTRHLTGRADLLAEP